MKKFLREHYFIAIWVVSCFLLWFMKSVSDSDMYRELRAYWGDAETQYSLATHFYWKNDEEKSFKWNKRAADSGHTQAQFWVGKAFLYGNGINRDFMQAIKYFMKAAEHGDRDADFWLGAVYYEIYHNRDEAIRWFNKAIQDEQPELRSDTKRLAELVLRGVNFTGIYINESDKGLFSY